MKRAHDRDRRRYGGAAATEGAPMGRRLVISLILAAIVFVLQLWLGRTTAGLALVSAVIALVIGYAMLHRWFLMHSRTQFF